MHFIPTGPNAWFNMPREGGVAYTSQQPWVENATIKQNIVFDSGSVDEARYRKGAFVESFKHVFDADCQRQYYMPAHFFRTSIFWSPGMRLRSANAV